MTRRFTNADLERLTEGTTPRPWSEKFTGYIIGPEGQPIVEWNAVGDRKTALPNAHLIAAAPELAAELHRIRTELEELRDEYFIYSEDSPEDDVSARCYARCFDDIDRILRVIA